MTDSIHTVDVPLIAQVMGVHGPCALLRLYEDAHLRVEPSAATKLVLLNLGPGHALLESITFGWFDGTTDRTTYFPFGTVIVPGEGKDIMGVEALLEIMTLMGSPVTPGVTGSSRAFRLHARVAGPGQLIDVRVIVKPLAVTADGTGYFGVVEDTPPPSGERQ